MKNISRIRLQHLLVTACVIFSTSSLQADKAVGFAGQKAGERKVLGGIPFRWCPSGEFSMGSPRGSEAGTYGYPATQHNVRLTKGFWMAETECTQDQWEQVMGTTVVDQQKLLSKRELEDAATIGLAARRNPRHPMFLVNRVESYDYCNKLTIKNFKSGALPSGWEYSLPTEAQWEFACRAGSKGTYSFGDSPLDLAKYGNFMDKNSRLPRADKSQDDGSEFTAPVGQYSGNAWGLKDMHGNVIEWCKDVLGSYPRGPVKDPVGPSYVIGISMTLRGGGWASDLWNCGSAVRLGGQLKERTFTVGFRPCIVEVANAKSHASPLPPDTGVSILRGSSIGRLFRIQEYEWAAGNAPAKMMPVNKGVGVLSFISGRFLGGGESVWVTTDPDGFWYLKGKSMQRIWVRAMAIEPAGIQPFGASRTVTWKSGEPTVRLVDSRQGFACLSGLAGQFLAGETFVRVRLDPDGWWYLEGRGPKSISGMATVVPWASGIPQREMKTYKWNKGDAPIKMLHRDEGFCFLSGIGGGFNGGGESVSVYVGDDGFWYLHGNTGRTLTRGEAVAVRFPR